MGTVTRVTCKDCGFQKEFSLGSGKIDFQKGKDTFLYRCKDCGNLVTKKLLCNYDEETGVKPKYSRVVKCKKCSGKMELVSPEDKLICPKCHSRNCEYDCRWGLWD